MKKQRQIEKKDGDHLDNLRHSTAHLLAAAVLELWPKTKRAIGPAIENGFYFDFDFGDIKISESDFPKIEKVMHKLLTSWKGFEKHDLTSDKAKKEYPQNPYKHELIDEFSEKGKKKVSFYKSGNYWDLCKGGHVAKPNEELKYFKLLSVAGAYWRGDEKNQMLTRIYGTAWPSKEKLDNYIFILEEAKKRDHRKIGKALDLFTFSDLVGPGFPLFTPKGTLVRRLLNDYIESLQTQNGFTQVWTPQVGKAELFKKSGHYSKYKEDMFKVISNYSNEEFYLKPMNCPQHTQIFASRSRSYRELPIRYSDFAMLYRDEKPGELSGLARVRSFSQDDSHIFCTEEQVDEEIDKLLSMTKEVMGVFGFKYRYRLSTRDPNNLKKYLGSPKVWDKVEKWAEKIMIRNSIDHYDAPGEAAFYAPKMDLMATDALGREWQLSTIQIDYVQPERFGLSYVSQDGSAKTPVMLHRAILGSVERFMMIILEHFIGAFPTWLAPVQIKILAITERNIKYANRVMKELQEAGLRCEVDDRSETLGAKIRDAQNEKVPYMLIIGDKEEAAKKVAVRLRSGKDLGQLSVTKLIDHVQEKISTKSLEL